MDKKYVGTTIVLSKEQKEVLDEVLGEFKKHFGFEASRSQVVTYALVEMAKQFRVVNREKSDEQCVHRHG